MLALSEKATRCNARGRIKWVVVLGKHRVEEAGSTKWHDLNSEKPIEATQMNNSSHVTSYSIVLYEMSNHGEL